MMRDHNEGEEMNTVEEKGLLAAADMGGSADEEISLDFSHSSVHRPTFDKKERYKEIAKNFAPLGWISFGGPQLHIAMLQKIFVEKHKWISETTFAEILAVAQGIPGPSSTQMVVAAGAVRGGSTGGLISLALFLCPGAFLMMAAGLLADRLKAASAPQWLASVEAGLTSAAVALVAVAAVNLGRKVCPDRTTRLLAILSGAITSVYQSAWIFPLLFLFSGLTSYVKESRKQQQRESNLQPSSSTQSMDMSPTARPDSEGEGVELGYTKRTGWVLFGAFFATLALLFGLRKAFPSAKLLACVEIFYRVGALIFGGGQVVIPMLLSELGDSGLITDQQFISGLSIVQLLPGPVFNLSAYLGALVGGFPGGLACLIAMFAPGILLIFAALPFWHEFRRIPWIKKSLVGLNACAVGLVTGAFLVLWAKIIQNNKWRFLIAWVSGGLTFTFNAEAHFIILGGGLQGLLLGLISMASGQKWL